MYSRRTSIPFAFSTCLLIASCASTSEKIASSDMHSAELAQLPAALNGKLPSSAIQTEASIKPENEKIIMPTIGEVSQEWKLHPYELHKQSLALEKFIRFGRYPKQFCNKGQPRTPKDRPLCQQVSLIVASYKKNTRHASRRSKPSSGFAKTGRRFKITKHNLAWVQNKHFDDVVASISPMSTQQILSWTPSITNYLGCPRNLSAAAIRKLENLLPNNEAKMAIEKLYAHASACLKPNDTAYSITHFRQALLRVLWGDTSRARVSASLAPLGAKGEELPRTLFWAGMLQTDPSLRNKYWSQLISDYPLSFHALNAQKQLMQDPLAEAIERPKVSPSRDGRTKALTLSLRWFETLMLNENETAASRLAFWISENFKDELSLGNIIYITHLKSRQSMHQSSFGFVWNQIESRPENMNEQTLKLMFPLPYWEVFKRNSGSTDPLLIASVARQESAFNPNARSPANARGLLQLLPVTAHAMAGRRVNLYEPETNARLGSRFLKSMVDKFNSVEMALAAYNAGPLRIPTWRKRYPTKSSLLFIDLIPYRETRNYVANILRNNYWYSRLYDNTPTRTIASSKPRTQSALVAALIKGTRNMKPTANNTIASTTLEPSAR